MEKIYIAEIAGKDNIAAMVKFIKGATIKTTVIPTIVYTGTEYGRLQAYEESISYLKKLECSDNIVFKDTQILQNEKLWNILNAKYQYLINNKYGFYTPCILCHFYTHIVRIPLYIKNNASGLITGERWTHDGNIKVNQHPLTLDCFSKLFNKYGINLEQPNLKVDNTNKIDSIINDESIIKKANDVKCVLSGNLFGFSCKNDEEVRKLAYYISDFVEPIGDYCLSSIIDNSNIDLYCLERLIEKILSQ